MRSVDRPNKRNARDRADDFDRGTINGNIEVEVRFHRVDAQDFNIRSRGHMEVTESAGRDAELHQDGDLAEIQIGDVVRKLRDLPRIVSGQAHIEVDELSRNREIGQMKTRNLRSRIKSDRNVDIARRSQQLLV